MVAGNRGSWRWALVASGLGLASLGCSAAQKEGADANPLAAVNGEAEPGQPTPTNQPGPPGQPPTPTGPTYTVEIRREGYTTQFVRMPHVGEMHLQEALEKSGTTKKLKRMELYVMRTPPGGGPRQRMTSAFNSGERRVAWESDYAIYPGDHIVAIEDTSSEFDHMVNRFLGPLGGGE